MPFKMKLNRSTRRLLDPSVGGAWRFVTSELCSKKVRRGKMKTWRLADKRGSGSRGVLVPAEPKEPSRPEETPFRGDPLLGCVNLQGTILVTFATCEMFGFHSDYLATELAVQKVASSPPCAISPQFPTTLATTWQSQTAP